VSDQPGDHVVGSMRVAIVTGAASGLGRATVARLRSTDWIVVGLDVNLDPADESLVQADVTDEAAIVETVSGAVEKYGRLDAVVGCAGVFSESFAPVPRLPVRDRTRTHNIKLSG
jgi:NAD(P)-dependent dehydrogenase (short-subunit alcohol dehydrogenase family)